MIDQGTQLMADHDAAHSARSATIFSIAGFALVTLLGFALRAVTLVHYDGHVDEPASLLAVKRVGEIGYPQFPSGVLYLQGAAFSYVAAPLSWILDDSALLQATRVLSMVISVFVIPLSMKLMREITGSLVAALLTGFFVSADPNLILWSVTIRPYGVLAAEIVLLLLLFARLLRDGPATRFGRVRVVIWIPILVTVGTFTHVGFWLAIPALALVALLVWRESLLATHRSILLSGLLSTLPLVTLLALGSLSGTRSGTGEGYFGRSLLGSHLFSLESFRESPGLSFSIWTDNFTSGVLYVFMPYLILLSTGVVTHAVLDRSTEHADAWRSWAVGTIVVVHWSVILAVAVLVTSDPAARYLTLILPLGYMIVVLALLTLWTSLPRAGPVLTPLARILVVAIFLIPAILYGGAAASWRITSSGSSPDYWNAVKWASEQFEDHETVLTALPPSAYFWFTEDQLENVMFLAGPESSSRTHRYVVADNDGVAGDYWLGLHSIRSTGELCTVLQEIAADGWIIVDGHRLRAGWAFLGPFADVIRGTTEISYRGENGIVVQAVLPVGRWSESAQSTCSDSAILMAPYS